MPCQSIFNNTGSLYNCTARPAFSRLSFAASIRRTISSVSRESMPLITQEVNDYEYRFKDIVDLDTREVLFTVEHEVRSQTHPLFGRPLVNRNPAQTNSNYRPGHDAISWAMA